MCANSEGSGETVQMRRIAKAFAGCLCGKYHNLSWLNHVPSYSVGTYSPNYGPREILCLSRVVFYIEKKRLIEKSSATLLR